MKSTIYIMCAMLLSFCNSPANKKGVDNDLGKNSSTERLSQILSYNPIKILNNTDSVIFFFSHTKPFDTTWSILLNKHGDNYEAVYTQMLPIYHRNPYDYLDTSGKLLFYDGMNFKISNSQWKQILSNSNLDEYKSTDTTSYTCMHCPFYILFYNGKFFNSNLKDQEFLKSLSWQLKNSLINPLLSMKKARFN